jgi:hypothetical protein
MAASPSDISSVAKAAGASAVIESNDNDDVVDDEDEAHPSLPAQAIAINAVALSALPSTPAGTKQTVRSRAGSVAADWPSVRAEDCPVELVGTPECADWRSKHAMGIDGPAPAAAPVSPIGLRRRLRPGYTDTSTQDRTRTVAFRAVPGFGKCAVSTSSLSQVSQRQVLLIQTDTAYNYNCTRRHGDATKRCRAVQRIAS